MTDQSKPNDKKSQQLYIVWNSAKNEGFITDDLSDAQHAAGIEYSGCTSSLGDAFRELYIGEFDDDDEFEEGDAYEREKMQIQTIKRADLVPAAPIGDKAAALELMNRDRNEPDRPETWSEGTLARRQISTYIKSLSTVKSYTVQSFLNDGILFDRIYRGFAALDELKNNRPALQENTAPDDLVKALELEIQSAIEETSRLRVAIVDFLSIKVETVFPDDIVLIEALAAHKAKTQGEV